MNSQIYHFGYLIGRLEANRENYPDWAFDEFLCDTTEYKCRTIVFTDEMFQRVLECYCNPVELVDYKGKKYGLVGDTKSLFGAVFINDENYFELLEDKKLKKEIKKEFDVAFEDEEDEDQDDFTERICENCNKEFDLKDDHYYDEENSCCYCSKECYETERCPLLKAD